MNKIVIGFSRRTKCTPASLLIRKLDNAEFSHVYIRRNSRYGEYVYESTFISGTHFVNIGSFLEKNKIVHEYEFQIDDQKLFDIISFCIQNSGKPYSIKQFWTLVKLFIKKKLGCKIDLNRMIDKDEAFICSEIGVMIADKILDLQIKNYDLYTPRMVHEIILWAKEKNNTE